MKVESAKELLYALMYTPGAAPLLDGVQRLPEISRTTVIARRAGFTVPAAWYPEDYQQLFNHIISILEEPPDGPSTQE